MKKVLLLLAFVMSNFAQAQAPIQYFSFDGTTCNATSTSCLANFSSVFREDRFNLPNGSILVSAGGTSGFGANNLPVGTASRSISVWVKFITPLGGNNNFYIFGYGGSLVGQGFNLTQDYNSANAAGQHSVYVSANASGPRVAANVSVQLNTWYHYVAILDNSFVKIYRDGQMIQNDIITNINTVVNNTGFSLGGNTTGNVGSGMQFDDLTIYDRAISGTEVTALYNQTRVPVLPTIGTTSSRSEINSSVVTYFINANNFPTTSVIKYGLTSNNLANEVTGIAASGNDLTKGSIQLNGLIANTVYYYRIDASNSGGTVPSSIGTFTTKEANSLVADYSFNNTYNDTNGGTPFRNLANTTSFVTGRNGQANSALEVVASGFNGTTASIAAPTGTNQRTISLWYRVNSNSTAAVIFSYGTNVQYSSFGSYFVPNVGNLWFSGFNYDFDFGGNYPANVWRHLVMTFDGSLVSLYINGNFIRSVSRSLLNTSFATDFVLGNNIVTMQYDDLKVFNYSLSASEVSSLHSNNTLSSSDFSKNNLKVASYPNPVKDILNIETETEIKSVEIYNLLGQKVKTAKSRNINVADLSNGTYMVRVEDTNNAVETMKIVKK